MQKDSCIGWAYSPEESSWLPCSQQPVAYWACALVREAGLEPTFALQKNRVANRPSHVRPVGRGD